MNLPRVVKPLSSCLLILACGGEHGYVRSVAATSMDPPGPAGMKAEYDLPSTCTRTLDSQTITFVHVNDLHGSYGLDKDGVSPYARIRGYFENVRRESPHALLTDGGDDHEKGSVAELLSEGIATREATRALRFDVRVIGNHDFAWGTEKLLAFSHDPYGAVLASNTEYVGGASRDFGATDYAAIRRGCVRIGFFGMVSKPWDERDEQYTGDFLPEFRSRWDWSQRAAEVVAAHRSEVDIMVMLSHLGFDEDLAVAAEVPGIDIVLGGHSHRTTIEPARAGGALVVQAGSFANEVARLDIEYDRKNGRIGGHRLALEKVATLPFDVATNQAIATMLKHYAPRASAPIGQIGAQRGTREIAHIAARAAVEAGGLDAAIVDEDTVSSTWSQRSVVDQQALLDTFKVERQRANTPGFSSLYVTPIDGASLAHLSRNLRPSMAYEGPSTPVEGRSYLLGLQKGPAMHPRDLLPDGVEIAPPLFMSEMWQVLEAFGRARSRSCRYLDSDSEPHGVNPCAGSAFRQALSFRLEP